MKLIFYICMTFCALGLMGCSNQQEMYQARIISLEADMSLKLSNGNLVQLIGVGLPFEGNPNYSQEWVDRLRILLVGKEGEFKTVVKKHPLAYPREDRVELYLSGKNMNQHLLRGGLAFFREDYWSVFEKEKFRSLETKARAERLGVWSELKALKPLYVRKKSWKKVYPPFCKNVSGFSHENWIIYYINLPEASHKGIIQHTRCDS